MQEQIRPPKAVVYKIMKEALERKISTKKELDEVIRKYLTSTSFRYPKGAVLWEAYRTLGGNNPAMEKMMRIKTVRTDSGVVPITVLTKPFPCPGRCVYCPLDARMPKSYLATEPAAARALSLKFDPYQQVRRRVQMLEGNGHEAKKIELIIKGGTWSAYTWKYREWFIKRCFDGANRLDNGKARSARTHEQAQKMNESAKYRVIGLTIETRPDWITTKEIVRLRSLGVTRVELGVQSPDDALLKKTKRGHTVQDIVHATHLLKMAGFKVDYHIMPGQPGSTPAKDLLLFKKLFSDPRFQPDMVKLYPCVVLPSAELADWYAKGLFKPLEGTKLIQLLAKMKASVPRYCRISRVIRDFPTPEIAGGNKASHLRDVVKAYMLKQGMECHCLRCREAGHRPTLHPKTKTKLFVESYESAGGTEYFLSIEDVARTTLLAFARLRLPDTSSKKDAEREEIEKAMPEIKGAAFIRELHTYGQALDIEEVRKEAVQHKGLGRKLMKEAEAIAKKHKSKRMAVISGVGVRAYYRLLGYHKQGTYMVKQLA